MTELEYTQFLRGFEQHALEFHNPVEEAERMRFLESEINCSLVILSVNLVLLQDKEKAYDIPSFPHP